MSYLQVWFVDWSCLLLRLLLCSLVYGVLTADNQIATETKWNIWLLFPVKIETQFYRKIKQDTVLYSNQNLFDWEGVRGNRRNFILFCRDDDVFYFVARWQKEWIASIVLLMHVDPLLAIVLHLVNIWTRIWSTIPISKLTCLSCM